MEFVMLAPFQANKATYQCNNEEGDKNDTTIAIIIIIIN
jgi:hypothetical protein